MKHNQCNRQKSMENAMSTPQVAQQDYAHLALRMYCDALQQWKKTYESAIERSKNSAIPGKTDIPTSERANTTSQNFGVQFFRRTIEGQMGLCRFFENRWSNYMNLPDAFSTCKSPLDMLPLQASFVKQLVEDYANEGARVMQSYFPAAQRYRR
jgi:hypothetical protein